LIDLILRRRWWTYYFSSSFPRKILLSELIFLIKKSCWSFWCTRWRCIHEPYFTEFQD